MAFLLDTNLLSELRNEKRSHPNVKAWELKTSQDSLYISVISLLEIKRGILMARKKDRRFSELLERWYEEKLKPAFDGQILPVDASISERCALLMSQRTRGLADALIVSTAYVHNLTLVTRNEADFADAGVKIVNPWKPE